MSSSDRRPPRIGQARRFRLGEEPADELAGESTAEERLAMVAELSRRMWELGGRPAPRYKRREIPVHVIRRAEGEAS